MKNFGGTGYDGFNSVIEDADGNYVAIGASESNLTSLGGTTNTGNYDFVIAKFNSSLTLLSIKNMGSTVYDSFDIIKQDRDNNYIVIGRAQGDLTPLGGSTNKGSNDFVIAKFNTSLNKIGLQSLGGTSDDGFNDVIQDNDRNYVAIGNTQSDLTSYGGGISQSSDIVLAKFDSSLNSISIRNFGGSGVEYGYSIAQNSQGNYVIAGYSSSDLTAFGGQASQGADFLICIMDKNNNILTMKNLGGAGSDVWRNSTIDNDGNYLAVGYTSSDLTLIGGSNTSSGTHLVVGKYNEQDVYATSNNLLQSTGIPLGSTLDNIKVNLNATLPTDTNYSFYISTNGTDWTAVDKVLLDGNSFIAMPSAGDTIYWKAVLSGTTMASPKFDIITISIGTIINITGVSLDQENMSLDLGSTGTLVAAVVPNDATNKVLIWSSDNTVVATVDENGVVTGVGAGTAVITVTTVDGGFTDTCTVQVNTVPVTGVSLNKESTTISVGGTETLIAAILPENATNKGVVWSLDNTAVATVDQNGMVTGIGTGTATITVSTVEGNFADTCMVQVVIPVTGISINEESITINVGGGEALAAIVSPENASNSTVNWSSDNTAVATVSPDGVVTGVSAGTAIITVTSVDGGFTDTCTVQVTIVQVSGVNLNKEDTTISVGGTETLIATISPENASNNGVSWSSSNEEVATVDENGVVRGVSSGTAIITVTTIDGGFTDTCTIQVATPVTGVSLSKESTEINVGYSETLIADVSPENATNKALVWSSDNTVVAAVDENGVVTGVIAGTANITVTTVDGGFTDTCTVQVNAVPVTGVSLNKENTTINADTSETLVATLTPFDATNKSFIWNSDNENIATVDTNGLVTGISKGFANITVTTSDGGYTATCTVEVVLEDFPPIYSEDFSTTTYKNSSATTADWEEGSLPISPQLLLKKLKHYGGIYTESLYSVIQDVNGDYVAVGTISRPGIFYETNNDLEYDFYIAKFDTNLNLISSKTFGSPADNVFGDDYLHSIVQDNEGNYVCVGYSDGDLTAWGGTSNRETATGNNTADFVIVKLDGNLNVLKLHNTGGTDSDIFKSVIQDDEGNYVVVGTSSSDLSWMGGIGGTNTSGYSDFVIMKFDRELNKLKIKNFGGSLGDSFSKVIQDKNRNYIAVGATSSNLSSIGGPQANGLVIVKFDKNLNITGIRGNLNPVNVNLHSVIQANNTDHYVVSGYYGSALKIISLDPSFNVLTQNSANISTTSYSTTSLVEDNKGNYHIFSWSNSDLVTLGGTSAQGADDFVITRFSNNLDLVGVTNWGGDKADWFYSGIRDLAGNFIAAGSSYSTSLTSIGGNIGKGSSDFVIAKLVPQYDINNNMIQSTEIQLGEVYNSIKVLINASIPDGTDYSFSISVNGTDWIAVDKYSLDGNCLIDLPSPSDSLYWKIKLNGTCDAAPILHRIKFYSPRVLNPVTGVSLNEENITISVGGSATLVANIMPAESTNKSVTWNSSDDSIVTVDNNGVVTGLSTGEAVITVKTVDGNFTDICLVQVATVPLTGININKDTTTIGIGNTEKLDITFSPENATNKAVTWISSNEAIATVDANGLVTGISSGTVTITVSAVEGAFSDNCTVQVSIVPTDGINLSKEITTIDIGSTETLEFTVTPEEATNNGVIWSSDNQAVAVVDNDGTVSGVSAGVATITIATVDGGFTDSCLVNVIQPVTGVSLDKQSITVSVGSSEALAALVLPEDASIKEVTWNSSNEAVAYVDENGVVTGIGAGTATITVTTVNGGYTATCLVEVPSLKVSGVVLNLEIAKVNVNRIVKLYAAVLPENATNKAVAWSSSDPNIATVDNNGVVRGVSEGTATITVDTLDGGYTDSCTVQVESSDFPAIYYEDFSTAAYKDVSTTADWVNGSLPSNPQVVLAELNHYGGSSPDIFYSVIQDKDGNYVAAGTTSRPGYGSSDFEYDFYVAKFDANLSLINSKTFGSPMDTVFGDDYVFSLIQDSDGNYVCVGISDGDLTAHGGSTNRETSTGNNTHDFVIFKLDTNLNLLKLVNTGGDKWDYFKSVIQDHQGNYIVVGVSDSSLSHLGGSASTGYNDFVIMKFDKNLNRLKTKNFGGTLGDFFEKIILDDNNNYVVVGGTSSNLTSIGGPSSNGLVIVKFDTNFNIIKIRSNQVPVSNIFLYSLIQDASGDYVMSGCTPGTAPKLVIVKLDRDFNLIRKESKDIISTPSFKLNSLIQDNSGNYYVIGYSDSNLVSMGGTLPNGENDFIITKFNNNLDFISVTNLGGTSDDISVSSVVDTNGNYIVVGSSGSNLTSLGGNSGNGHNDFIISKFVSEYLPQNNLLQSSAISLEEGLDSVTILVNDILPEGTSFRFYLSTDGNQWFEINRENLDGTNMISLPSISDKIYWKAELLGNTYASPFIKSITINKISYKNYIYDDQNRLDYIILSTGKIIDYEYDDIGNLLRCELRDQI